MRRIVETGFVIVAVPVTVGGTVIVFVAVLVLGVLVTVTARVSMIVIM